MLETDYDSYQILYSCIDLMDGGSYDAVNVFSRTPELTEELKDYILDTIAETVPLYDLEENAFVDLQGEANCPYDIIPQ